MLYGCGCFYSATLNSLQTAMGKIEVTNKVTFTSYINNLSFKTIIIANCNVNKVI